MKENILFLDYSVLPVSNDSILENIDSAIILGYKIIVIDFGQYFPWSMGNIIKSDFSYSDKLIDRISSVCIQHNIILVPVLSVLIESDYILNDTKYLSLKEDGCKSKGLNIASCGINKLIEELIEDIFSLLPKSVYLLFELPSIINIDKEWIKSINPFIERLALYMSDQNKKLILGGIVNLENLIPDYVSSSIEGYYKKQADTIKVFKGQSFSIFCNIYKLKLANEIYFLQKINGSHDLSSAFSSELFLINDIVDNKKIIKNTNLETLDVFFTSLDRVWGIIKKSREYLSIMDRTPHMLYRIRFYRVIQELKHEFILLKKQSKLVSCSLEKKYQTGYFKFWMNSKIDPVYSQLITLNLKAKHIKEGS